MKSDTSTVCLVIGSNIEPERNLRLAVEELRRRFGVVNVSNAWETRAVGSEGPNFLNAAVLIRSDLDPYWLKMRVLRPLERGLGRIRTGDKFAPRPIDIDIVAWGGLGLDPDLWRYAYLAGPTAEVLPNLRSPLTGERLESASRRLRLSTPVRLQQGVLLPRRYQRLAEQTPSLSTK
jgi:2-amino-4-hydroxy-6-hydroxymethyldihydropteridine diphosphokinase